LGEERRNIAQSARPEKRLPLGETLWPSHEEGGIGKGIFEEAGQYAGGKVKRGGGKLRKTMRITHQLRKMTTPIFSQGKSQEKREKYYSRKKGRASKSGSSEKKRFLSGTKGLRGKKKRKRGESRSGEKERFKHQKKLRAKPRHDERETGMGGEMSAFPDNSLLKREKASPFVGKLKGVP